MHSMTTYAYLLIRISKNMNLKLSILRLKNDFTKWKIFLRLRILVDTPALDDKISFLQEKNFLGGEFYSICEFDDL